MLAVLREIIYGWAVPHQNIRHIVAHAFADNKGSHKLLLKAGFTFQRLAPLVLKMEHKGREDTSVNVYTLDL